LFLTLVFIHSQIMEDCSICFQTLDNSTATSENCKHQFCLSCFKKWAIINPTCPLDRTPITNINIHEKNKFVMQISISQLHEDVIGIKIGQYEILINNARLLFTDQYNELSSLKIAFSNRKSIPIILEKSMKYSKENIEDCSYLINKSISDEINFLVKIRNKANTNYEKTNEMCVELRNKISEIKTLNSLDFTNIKQRLQSLSYRMKETNVIWKKCIRKFNAMIKMYEKNNKYLKNILQNKNSEYYKENLEKIKELTFIWNRIYKVDFEKITVLSNIFN